MLVYGCRLVAAAAMRAWLRVYHRFRVSGARICRPMARLSMVANHSSHLDALCILAAMPLKKVHRAFPAAAQDYFFVSLPRLAFASVVVNALPFDRETHIRQSLALCQKLLATPGNILILFPEGTRSATGELGEFKPGIGLMLAGSEYPVVPCQLRGAARAWPKGSWCPRPRHVSNSIVGKPRSYAHLKRGKESALEIATELHRAIQELDPPDRNRLIEVSGNRIVWLQ